MEARADKVFPRTVRSFLKQMQQSLATMVITCISDTGDSSPSQMRILPRVPGTIDIACQGSATSAVSNRALNAKVKFIVPEGFVDVNKDVQRPEMQDQNLLQA